MTDDDHALPKEAIEWAKALGWLPESTEVANNETENERSEDVDSSGKVSSRDSEHSRSSNDMMNRRSLLAILAGAPIAAKLAPVLILDKHAAMGPTVLPETNTVEVVEYYASDMLIRRTIGGFDVPFTPRRQPFVRFNPPRQ